MGLSTFLLVVSGTYLVFATIGLAVAPLLSLPKKLLSKYELRKVHLVTDRIDAGVRAKVAGALSHPEQQVGLVSLDGGAVNGPASPDEPTSRHRVS